MPIKLSKTPIIQTFTLEKTDIKYGSDGDQPTTVTIKQATQAQHERRQQLFATMERRYNNLEPDETTLVQTANSEELKRLETLLTLVECNITQEDGAKLLFPSRQGPNGLPRLDMNDEEFIEAWGSLPPDVATEIHEKVTELNFMWSRQGG